MMSARILVVDDSKADRALVADALRRRGMRCAEASSLREASQAAASSSPDLVVLDLGMPDGDGRAILGYLAARGYPVLVCSGDPRETTRIDCLSSGAQDYVIKPFAAQELALRVQNLLTRRTPSGSDVRLGRITIDVEGRKATLDGQVLKLPPKEFDLLLALASQPGRAHSRGELLERVWSGTGGPGLGNVTEHMRRLRNRLNRPGQPALIRTSRGAGYILDDRRI